MRPSSSGSFEHEYLTGTDKHEVGTWTWTLHVEPDHMTILDEQGEGVWCGRIEWATRENNYGWWMRPDGFTGRAEIIARDHGHNLWWQPPDDIEIGSDVHRQERGHIKDLLEYGYRFVYVTCVHERPDGYRHTWRSGGLGGIGPFDDEGYIQEVAKEQIAEILDEIGEPWAL